MRLINVRSSERGGPTTPSERSIDTMQRGSMIQVRPMFSERFDLSPKPVDRVVWDAPAPVRRAYVIRVLKHLVYIDRDTRYFMKDRLGAKQLYEELAAMFLLPVDEGYQDSWQCLEVLYSLVQDELEWTRFYDSVEYVGSRLLTLAGESHASSSGVRDESLMFSKYRDEVNRIFELGGVVWRLDSASTLQMDRPEEVQRLESEVKKALSEDFSPAHDHLEKALRFMTDRRLIDPANAVKEAISAVEATANTLCPSATTLGDCIKEMRKAGYPQLLVLMIEKAYAYASNEPSVRHGKNVNATVTIADAELLVHVSLALIRYLLGTHGHGSQVQ